MNDLVYCFNVYIQRSIYPLNMKTKNKARKRELPVGVPDGGLGYGLDGMGQATVGLDGRLSKRLRTSGGAGSMGVADAPIVLGSMVSVCNVCGTGHGGLCVVTRAAGLCDAPEPLSVNAPIGDAAVAYPTTLTVGAGSFFLCAGSSLECVVSLFTYTNLLSACFFLQPLEVVL